MNQITNSLKNLVKQKLEVFLKQLANIGHREISYNCAQLEQNLVLYFQNALTNDKSFPQNLEKSLQNLSYVCRIPRTKGRLCGGLLAKGQKAYKCYECMTQQNSVLCQKCFQLDKHIGHDFERFQVFGGCCDCGDIEKWKQSGFCNQHSKDEEIEIILDEDVLSNFLSQHVYAFQMLMRMYYKFQQFEAKINEQSWNLTILPVEQRSKEEMINRIRKIIDFYGVSLFYELIEFNKEGKYANAMTNDLFNKKIVLQYFDNGETNIINQDIFYHMFTLLKLKETPEKICDLCITLFPMIEFRQKVTLRYLQCYNKDYRFPTSSYTHLSSQLLTSHLMITKLIKQGRIHALSYYPKCNNQQEVQKLAEGFLRYYYDMKYLSKLYGYASVEYFKLHALQKKFVNLGEYRIILNQFPRAIDYYGLDQIFLDKMLFVIKVFQKDETQSVQKQALRELYEFITTYSTQKANYFRPQERFLALIIFNKVKGNLDLLDNELFMQNLFQSLGVKNFKKEIEQLIRNLTFVLLKASEILQNTTLVHQNYTFYSFYFKKSQKLFNLDAILLKILYKMTVYYNKIQNQSQIKFDEILIKFCYGIQQRYLQLANSDIEMDQQDTHLDLVLKFAKTLKNYISFVLQCLYSDLPQLAIMCTFQPTERELKESKLQIRMPIQQLARHYYLLLLQSEQTNKVLIKSFKANCELFFKQEQLFKSFTSINKDPLEIMKLIKPTKVVNNKISEIYFKSLNSLPANKYIGPQAPPYLSWNKHIELGYLLQTIHKTINLVKNANQKAQQIEGLNSPLVYKVGDVPQMLVQVWKITLLSQSHKTQSILKQMLQADWLKKGIQSLGPQMLNKIKAENDKQISISQQKQRKEQQKKKLIEKKRIIKEKLSKRAQIILEKQTEAIIQESKYGHLCSLCKQNTIDQHLCLFGFVAFTSYFISQKIQQLIPVFETCGHAVHKSCLFTIINKNSINKIYSFCPLCKNPTNIQLPIKQQYTSQDRDGLTESLKKIYQILQYQFKELQVILRSSLAYEILFKGFLLPEVFQKNLILYKILYQIYLQADKQHPLQIHNIRDKINSQLHILQKVLTLIELMIATEESQKHRFQNQNLGFSLQLIQDGSSLVRKLKHQKHISQLSLQSSPEIQIIKNFDIYPSLQKNLASMNSKYRGKCDQCGLVTNQQVICLNCPSFVTCSACQKIKPSQHSRHAHFGVNVFMKTSTGEVIYFMRNRFWKYPSIYEDYMGRAYSGIVKQRQNYELNESRLQQVKKDIYLCRIEQKVRYKQNETKQVNHQQIF